MGPAPWHLCFNSNQRFDETLARHAGFGSTGNFSLILKSEQNVISSLNHVATIATVAGSFAPQGFSGRFILLLKV